MRKKAFNFVFLVLTILVCLMVFNTRKIYANPNYSWDVWLEFGKGEHNDYSNETEIDGQTLSVGDKITIEVWIKSTSGVFTQDGFFAFIFGLSYDENYISLTEASWKSDWGMYYLQIHELFDSLTPNNIDTNKEIKLNNQNGNQFLPPPHQLNGVFFYAFTAEIIADITATQEISLISVGQTKDMDPFGINALDAANQTYIPFGVNVLNGVKFTGDNPPSYDTTLSSLSSKNGEFTLSPAFNSGVNNYVISNELDYEDSFTSASNLVSYTKTSPTATVAVSQRDSFDNVKTGKFVSGDQIWLTVSDGAEQDNVYKIVFTDVEVPDTDFIVSTSTTTATVTQSGNTVDVDVGYRDTGVILDLSYVEYSTRTVSTDDVDTNLSVSKINNKKYQVSWNNNNSWTTRSFKFAVKTENNTVNYTVNINRGNPSTDTNLSSVKIGTKNVNLSSQPYSVTLNQTDTSYTVQATFDPLTYISRVEYTIDGGNNWFDIFPVPSGGSVSHNIDFGEEHTVKIRVTAEDGTTTDDYDIEVKRPESSANDYSRLDFTNPSSTPPNQSVWGFTYAATSGQREYTVPMNSLTAVNTIDVVLSDVSYKATWKLYSGTGSNKTEIASKKINLQDLPRATHEYTFEIEAQDGSLKTQTFKIIKKDSNSAITKIDVQHSDAAVSLFTDNSPVEAPTWIEKHFDYKDGNTPPKIIKKVRVYLTYSNFASYTYTVNGGSPITGTLTYFEIDFNTAANNDIVITMKAEDGGTTVYNLRLTREVPNSNSYLTDIKVENQSIVGFQKAILDYRNDPVYLPTGTTGFTINVTFDPDAYGKSTAKYNGLDNPYVQFPLGATQTEVDILVTAEDGTTTTYKIKVIAADRNNNIDDIFFDKTLLDASDNQYVYNSSTKTYNLEIGAVETQVKITVLPEVSSASIRVNGNVITTFPYTINLTEGSNNVITVQATSGAGDVGDLYTFNINRPTRRTDNNLTEIRITTSKGTDVINNPSITTNHRVDADIVGEVTVSGILGTNGQTFQGGISSVQKNISDGATENFQLTVLAENGTAKTYTINVKRANNNPKLDYITIGGTDYYYASFTNEVLTLPTVAYATSSFTGISITTEDSKASHNGASTWTLSNTGTTYNTYQFTITAQDGVTKENYTVRVYRDLPDTETGIENLKVLSGTTNLLDGIIPSVSGTTTTYELRVDRTVSLTAITYDLKSSVATKLENWSNLNLIAGNTKIFTITVTAEDTSIKHYYNIEIEQKNDDNVITSIEFNGDQITFDANHEAIIPVLYAEDIATFTINAVDSYATKYINSLAPAGSYNLAVGDNVYRIWLVSEAGTKGIEYKVTVERGAADTEVGIEDLEVLDKEGNNLLDGITPTTSGTNTTYKFRVNRSVELDEIKYNLKSSLATASENWSNLDLNAGGTKTFTITVTAEDTSVKHYYNIEITQKNDDNVITSIEFNGDQITFDSNYEATIPVLYADDTATFTINAVDSYATKYINSLAPSGSYNLAVGDNVYRIWLVSEAGTKGIEYKVTVERGTADTEVGIEDLEVLDKNGNNLLDGITPTTSGTNTTYKFRVNRSVELDEIKYNLKSNLATASENWSNLDLNAGSIKTFTITVTAEDTSVKHYYNIEITQKNDDNVITSIEFNGDQITFDSNHEATIPVLYAVNIATFTINAVDSYATKYINGLAPSGSYNLAVGDNVYKIWLVSEAGTKGIEYKVTVERGAADTEVGIENLKILSGTTNLLDGIVPNVSGTTTTYELRVDRAVSLTAITYDLKSNVATASENWSNLNLTAGGTKTFTITVTAEDTSVKHYYHIEITQKNDNNVITSIEFNGDQITFDSNHEATIPVLYADDTATFTINVADSYATKYINGFAPAGSYNLAVGDNVYKIWLVSEAGTKGIEYEVKIERGAADTNAEIKDLEVMLNGINLIDNAVITTVGNTTTYKIAINRGPTDVDLIDYTLLSNVATVSESWGSDLSLIAGGTRTFTIDVTAQNPAHKKKYVVEITQKNDDNAITKIEVNGDEVDFGGAFSKTIEVNYSVKNVTFAITTSDQYATAYVNGQTSYGPLTLKGGANIFTIYARSERGEKGSEYTLTINQKIPSSDASLTQISFASISLVIDNPVKNDVYDYRVDRSVKSAPYTYTTGDANATVVVSKGTALAVGSNLFEFKVTAEDGTTVNFYYVEIFRNNDEYGFKDITIDGVPIENIATFDNQTNTWTLTNNYGFDITSIAIGATLLDTDTGTNAYIDGIGTKTLITGSQTFTLYGVSDYGTVMPLNERIHIKLEKNAANNDNYLDSLEVDNFSFDSGSFDKNVTSYTITLDENEQPTTINIVASVNSVFGNEKYIDLARSDLGVQTLNYGSNNEINKTFKVTVVSESNSSKEYSITIIKNSTLSDENGINSAQLKDKDQNVLYNFDISKGTQNTSGDPFLIDYAIDVVYLHVDKKDPNSTGDTLTSIPLVAGSVKDISFQIVSQSGIAGTNYVLWVERQDPLSDSSLDFIEAVYDNYDYLQDATITTSAGQVKYALQVPGVVDELELTAKLPLGMKSRFLGLGNTDTLQDTITLTRKVLKTYTFDVVAEDGSSTKYIIEVLRADDDSTLSALKVTIDGNDYIHDLSSGLTFQIPGQFAYSVNQATITATPTLSSASVTGDGIRSLSVAGGNNILTVDVTAEDGVSKTTYTVIIYRNDVNTNNKLDDLSIKDSNGNELVSSFSSNQMTYLINLDRTHTEVTISYTKGHLKQKITGNIGLVQLTAGLNTKYVYVEAEDGSTATYTIRITVEDTNNNVLELKVDSEVKAVVSGTTVYVFSDVAYSKTSAVIDIITENSYATKHGIGTKTLSVGLNTFIVYAESESGVEGVKYEIQVTRKAGDSSVDLESISLVHDGYDYIADAVITDASGTVKYSLQVGDEVDQLELLATLAQSSTATFVGYGTDRQITDTLALQVNVLKTYSFQVEAEDGTIKTHQIEVLRADDDSTLASASVEVDGTTYQLTFDVNNEATLVDNVDYSDNFADIIVTPNKSTATVSGDGVRSISKVGLNTYNVVVTAQDGVSKTTYKINITKNAADTNKLLDDLAVIDKDLNNQITFDSLTTTYDITLNRDHSEVTIDFTKGHLKQKVTGNIGLVQLTPGLNTKYVYVEAENGATQTYTIRITVEDTNNNVLELKVDSEVKAVVDGTTVYVFSDVAYSKTSAVIDIVTENSYATKVGTGTKALVEGLNEFTVYAVSESGDDGITYKIQVTRKAGDSSVDLESISLVHDGYDYIADAVITDASGTVKYSLQVGDEVDQLELLATLAQSSTATFVGYGTDRQITDTLALQVNVLKTYSFQVEAEDGTIKTHLIEVLRADDDSTLASASVEVDGTTYQLIFDANNEATLVDNVDYSDNFADIIAVPNKSTATVSGDGVRSISKVGLNTYNVVVTAQDGVSKTTYKINIIKNAADTNKYLDDLAVIDKDLNNQITFDSLTTTYDITLNRDHSEVTINFTKGHLKQKVTGNIGLVQLMAGLNTKYVYVEAENGATQTYTIRITVEDTNNNVLELKVDSEVKAVVSGTTVYVFSDVAYSKTSAVIDIVTENSYATKVGTGTKALVEGLNEFTVYAVSESGDDGIIYKIQVTRKAGDPSIDLESISLTHDGHDYIADAVITDASGTVKYSLQVGDEVDQLELLATLAQSSTATFVGHGTDRQITDTLALQVNVLKTYSFQVEAQDGTIKTHLIEVLRADDDSTLASASVEVDGTTHQLIFDANNEATLVDNVDYSDNFADIIAVPNKSTATVSGDGVRSISKVGLNTYNVVVTAQDGVSKTTYKINIIKNAANTNKLLDDLAVIDKDLNNLITFDSMITTYEITLNRDHSEVTINFTKGHPKQKVTGNIGLVQLTAGLNTKYVYVEAEDGSTATYTIKITVADPNNNVLELKVDSETKAVVSGIFEYEFADVNYSTNSVLIDIVTENSYATKVGTGTKALVVGLNEFTVYAISESGEKGSEYKIKVTRNPGDSNALLQSLKVFDINNNKYFNFDAPFDPDNKTHIITININDQDVIDDIRIEATTQEPTATITGIGNKIVRTQGDGSIFEVYPIKVTAEDGTEKNYEIRIIKSQGNFINDENDVIEVELIGSDNNNYFDSLFDPDITIQQSITVPYSISSVQLIAYLSTGASLRAGNNMKVYHLTPGVPLTITLQAVAQNGDISPMIYSITVTRDLGDTDDELKSLTITENPNNVVHTNFDLTNDLINITIKKEATTLTIQAVGPAKAKVVGGSTTVSATKKTHYIFVQPEDESLSQRVYTIVIEVEKDTDASLSNLVVRENVVGGLNLIMLPVFNPLGYNYAIDLSGTNVSEVYIDATASSAYATITGDGPKTLTTAQGVSTETFLVVVTAEDGISKKTYRIAITRNVDPQDDVSVNDISLIGNDTINYLGKTGSGAVNIFNPANQTYNITVPYKVTDLNLNIQNLNGAVSNNTGIQALNPDYTQTTTFSFFMTSVSGQIGNVYTVNVTRSAPSADNYLLDLQVDGVSVANFDPQTLIYSISVDEALVNQVNILGVKNHPNAIVTGNGIKNIVSGVNTIILTVEAEDLSQRVYTVIINSISYDNDIYSIGVQNYLITPAFDKTVYVYNVIVPYDVSLVNVIATANAKSTIVGTGIKTDLAIGTNVYNLYAISESGDVGHQYQVVVTRQTPDDDATLASLVVHDANGNLLDFTSPFKSSTTDYIIYLDDDNIMSVNISATTTSSKSNVYNTGNQLLEGLIDGKYHTIISIPVMAESGKIEKYTISFYRDVRLEDVAEIEELNLFGSDSVNYLGTNLNAGAPFDKTSYSYTVIVPYYVGNVNVVVSSTGQVYGAGIKSFGSSNTITYNVYVKSQSQVNESETYVIEVIRTEAQTDNVLNSLTVNGVLVAGFDPNVNAYSLSIPQQSSPIISIGATTDTNATIQGLGSKTLQNGQNVFPVSVTAQSGDVNTYTITIDYVDSNALLETLIIKGCNGQVYDDDISIEYDDFTFDPVEMEYVVKVDTDTSFVRITGAAQDRDGAQVAGFGTYRVGNEEETIRIHVSSADGLETQVYVIKLSKREIPNNNSQLSSLSVGGYGLVFDKNTYSYRLSVGRKVNQIALSAKAFNPNAKVSVIGYEQGQPSDEVSLTVDDIESGKNVVLIKVEAQDGSVSYYRLSVTRDAQPDYLLTILLIITFLLWVFTVVMFLIKQNRKDKKEDKKDVII